MSKSEELKENTDFGVAGYCLSVFLFILFFNAFGLYGQKFAAGVAISWGCGAVLWMVRVLFQSGSDPEGIDKPFNWQLFLLFPLFLPLAFPLWLIPVVLYMTYFLAVSAFGGQGKHIFNPVVVAVVFMLCGYGYTSVMHATRPFANPNDGYRVWTAGVPPRVDIRDVFSDIEPEKVCEASLKGYIPSLPGSCYGIVILIASFLYSLVFKRRLLWWIVAVGAVCSFAVLLKQPQEFCIAPINAIFVGIIPSLLLCGVADYTSIPNGLRPQIVYGIVFGFFSVLMFFYSSEILAPAYGFLLMQVISPLAVDICRKGKK